MKKIAVFTTESGISACDKRDKYLYDWKKHIHYLILIPKDQLFKLSGG